MNWKYFDRLSKLAIKLDNIIKELDNRAEKIDQKLSQRLYLLNEKYLAKEGDIYQSVSPLNPFVYFILKKKLRKLREEKKIEGKQIFENYGKILDVLCERRDKYNYWVDNIIKKESRR